MIVQDGKLCEKNVSFDERNFKRDKFGIKYPCDLYFIAEDDTSLRVRQTKVIDSSFFYLRFLSEMTLILPGETERKTIGITEYLTPKALKYQWLDWLTNMRIGRDGKGAFLK